MTARLCGPSPVPRRTALGVIAILMLPMTAADAGAQQRSFDRWHVAVFAGVQRGGPAGAMEAELRTQQWDDTSPGGWFGSEESPHPTSREGDVSRGITAGYRITSRLGLGAVLGTDALGYASGYRANEVALGTYLWLNPEVRTTALLGTFHVTGGLRPVSIRLDAGPALFRARASAEDETTSRIGGIIGGGAAVQWWYLRLSLDMQRRYVGEVDYGGRTATDPISGEEHALEASSANFDHDVVLIGLGLAF